MRPNPKKLNALQLKTLTILQAMAKDQWLANPPDADGTVLVHSLPHAHGDHLHIGAAVVQARDATGLGNPNVMSALARKGLLVAGIPGPPILSPEGLAYETGIIDEVLQQAD
jgi:hypothetical protein